MGELTQTTAEVQALLDSVITQPERDKLAILDPTTDADKPVSTATQAALDLKQPLATVLTDTTAAFTTEQEAKLGILDPTSDADKPVSTATQTALDAKQPLAAALTATTAGFTTAQETKLAGIQEGATAGGGGGSLITVATPKVADFNTLAARRYLVDTSGGEIEALMPTSPNIGDMVAFCDLDGTFADNNLVLDGNGNDIMRDSANGVIDSTNWNASFIFTTEGWLPEGA